MSRKTTAKFQLWTIVHTIKKLKHLYPFQQRSTNYLIISLFVFFNWVRKRHCPNTALVSRANTFTQNATGTRQCYPAAKAPGLEPASTFKFSFPPYVLLMTHWKWVYKRISKLGFLISTVKTSSFVRLVQWHADQQEKHGTWPSSTISLSSRSYSFFNMVGIISCLERLS